MNRLFLAACAVVLALLLTACGGSETSSNVSSVRGVTDTEIIIGSQNDLSGATAVLGVDLINSSRMRFDEVNAAGGIHGRKIRYIVEDAGYQLPKSIQMTNKLVNRDGIFAMFLSMGTPMNNAIMQGLFDDGVPNLFPVSGGRTMVEPFHRMQFTGRGIYYDEVRAGVRYFVEERGASNVCVMYQDSDFGIEVFEAARDQTAAMGIELAAISAHKPTDAEFTATVLRMRNANCDAIMMGTIYKDTILIMEAARKIGWNDVAFVGQNASYSRAIAEIESGASEGYYVFAHIAVLYADSEMDAVQRAWYDNFTERFGKEPGYVAIEGYRNADLLVQALEKAGPDLNVDSLLAALESIEEYKDIFGNSMTFGPEDHKGVDESYLLTVKDGRWVKLDASIRY